MRHLFLCLLLLSSAFAGTVKTEDGERVRVGPKIEASEDVSFFIDVHAGKLGDQLCCVAKITCVTWRPFASRCQASVFFYRVGQQGGKKAAMLVSHASVAFKVSKGKPQHKYTILRPYVGGVGNPAAGNLVVLNKEPFFYRIKSTVGVREE